MRQPVLRRSFSFPRDPTTDLASTRSSGVSLPSAAKVLAAARWWPPSTAMFWSVRWLLPCRFTQFGHTTEAAHGADLPEALGGMGADAVTTGMIIRRVGVWA